jgi:hypothetical protein
MKLQLNFSPVSLVGNTIIDAGYRSYDEELLKTLRREHGNTHIFRRDHNENSIIDIPVVSGVKPLSNVTFEIDLVDEYRFWPALLNAALVRAFHEKREILNDYPVQVLGNIKANFIQSPNLPDWVQMRPLYEFTPRTVFNKNEEPQFGLLFDVRSRNFIRTSCLELIKRGISPVGKYILVDGDSRDSRLTPKPRLVGRVARVEGDKLVLEDHREGFETVKAEDARLSGNLTDFDWCIRELLGKGYESVIKIAQSKANELHVGPGRLSAIQTSLQYLKETKIEAVPGVVFKFEDLLAGVDSRFPQTERIEKPTLVFDPAGTRKDVWNERGVKTNGPYDQRTFTPKKLNIAVICQSRFEGQVDIFIAKLLDGMPDVLTGPKGRQQARYGDGFLRRYQLERANVQTFTSNSSTLQGYLDACNDALSSVADFNFSWDLAIVQIEEDFKRIPERLNPYYGSKALLLKNHVAVQSVRLETMNQPTSNLVFTMNQMSLACYAKLGGRPWLLGAEQTTGHELVIGIGSHLASDSRIGGGKRYVGITTVFSSDGSYHLSERTNVVPFEDYSVALTETLKKTITRVRDEDNWRNTDRVRLIFHMFKPAKDIEAESIKNAVEALELENVTYAFLHIAPQHPFIIFNLDEEGEPPWANEKKGVLGPSRGLHLKINDHQSLVVFSGTSELKRNTDGIPRPCLLKLHKNSTFRDMTYLARQAFDFTAHSWRIMSPEPFPITIKYSDLISQRLTGLKHVEGWDDDAVKFREIGRTPWFL